LEIFFFFVEKIRNFLYLELGWCVSGGRCAVGGLGDLGGVLGLSLELDIGGVTVSVGNVAHDLEKDSIKINCLSFILK
jgi:hypothetical protein